MGLFVPWVSDDTVLGEMVVEWWGSRGRGLGGVFYIGQGRELLCPRRRILTEKKEMSGKIRLQDCIENEEQNN